MDDPDALALKARKYPHVPVDFVARQIKGWRRIQKKLPTWASNEDIIYPSTLPLEQCSSEVTASYKAGLFKGRIAADLTGGFGVDAYFLAQSFDKVFYLERDPELASVAKSNFHTLGIGERIEVVVGDGLSWLESYKGDLDLVYIDPARRDARNLKVSAIEDCEPNFLDTSDLVREKTNHYLLKMSPGLDIDRALEQVSGVHEVHVVSVVDECRELLFSGDWSRQAEPEIVCVNLSPSKSAKRFCFRRSEERKLSSQCSVPKAFLYEPNASIMKAGAFKTLTKQFGLPMLHPRTRIYTSDTLLEDFPGRIFQVEGGCPINEKASKNLFPEGRANVLSRNSGLTSEELKRKLKLADGGDIYAIGVSLQDSSRRVFRCARLD